MSINRESERAATRGHAAFYNLVLNSESLNDDYTQLRARLLGKDVVPHADFKIEQLSATEGNIHFCADPMFQAEQFVEFLMLRGELNRVGYKKLFGNFFDAKNIPIVQRLLQESRNEHFVNDYYDIQWYNAPPGGLLDLVDYFKEKLPEQKESLESAKENWQEMEGRLLPAMAEIVGIDKQQLLTEPKYVHATQFPFGSYYPFDLKRGDIQFLYTKGKYSQLVTLPVTSREGEQNSQWRAPYIIAEELIHLYTAEYADILPHDKKEAAMTATLYKIFNKIGDFGHTFWMASDMSRRLAGGTYENLREELKPIFNEDRTVIEVLQGLQ